MQLSQSGELDQGTDLDLIARYLPLHGTRLLELGCGAAFTTRRLAETFPDVRIVAAEVDEIQHAKNLQIDDLPGVTFDLAGMEAIPEEDASFDAVIMLKSLHHVPGELLERGFGEVRRVLRPGGLLYISEPVFAGGFNEILRLFNDEQRVRQSAFDAIRGVVDAGGFELVDEVHFASTSRFEGFAEFEQRIMGATHSSFAIDEALHARIRARFEPHVGADGVALFHNPMRVDILRKPA